VSTLRSGSNARRALIEAAGEELSTQGYAFAPRADIAERAGVTTGAVYAHFDSKLDLLIEALGLRTADKFVEVARVAADGPSGTLASALARGLVDAPLGRRGRILLDAIVFARRDAEMAEALANMVEVRHEAFTRMTAAGIDAGVIDPELDHDELARLVMALAFGMIVQRALDQPTASAATVTVLTERLLKPVPEEARRLDPSLALVRGRAQAVTRAESALEAAVAQAADAGQSLRRIGEAAGLSHERIRTMLAARHSTSP
jgi:AcrR family transcriptional regulator